MIPLHILTGEIALRSGSRLSLPEHRQIELYSRPSKLRYADAVIPAPAELAGLCRAFLLLDGYLGTLPSMAGTQASPWQRYLSLSRDGAAAGIIAQLYRLLRAVREVLLDPRGKIESRDGALVLHGISGIEVIAVEITLPGATLVESAVAYYLSTRSSPYPDAYVEAMMTRYYEDIIGEVRKYTDESKALYQFRNKYNFNRHFRFDCDNAKYMKQDQSIKIEISPAHADSRLFPIDFFIIYDDLLHIVPAEACDNGSIKLSELALWRARSSDGITLPADYRRRFSHDVAIPNQPMT